MNISNLKQQFNNGNFRSLGTASGNATVVQYSLDKYGNTYKWLEAYDRGSKTVAKILADTRVVSGVIRRVQGKIDV